MNKCLSPRQGKVRMGMPALISYLTHLSSPQGFGFRCNVNDLFRGSIERSGLTVHRAAALVLARCLLGRYDRIQRRMVASLPPGFQTSLKPGCHHQPSTGPGTSISSDRKNILTPRSTISECDIRNGLE